MTDIKDIIHLYLGQMAQTPTRKYGPEGGKSFKAIGRMMDIDLVINQVGVHFEGEAKEDLQNYPLSELKPILRKLESMTKEERQEYFMFTTRIDRDSEEERIRLEATRADFLRSKGFWLGDESAFDSGLIIEAKV